MKLFLFYFYFSIILKFIKNIFKDIKMAFLDRFRSSEGLKKDSEKEYSQNQGKILKSKELMNQSNLDMSEQMKKAMEIFGNFNKSQSRDEEIKEKERNIKALREAIEREKAMLKQNTQENSQEKQKINLQEKDPRDLSPKEKIDFLKDCVEKTKTNENINKAVVLHEAIEETDAMIKEKEEKIKEISEEIHSKSYENIQGKDEKIKEETQTELKADKEKEGLKNPQIKEQDIQKIETPEQQAPTPNRLEELEKQLKDEEKALEKLKAEKEALEENLDKAITNLMNSNDMSSLLKSLGELDKALAALIKGDKEEPHLDKKAKDREDELGKAIDASPDELKKVLKGFIKELSDNRQGVEKEVQEREQQQEQFIKLDRMIANSSKDLNAVEKLNQFYKDINEKHPTFKENYPKTFERGLKVIKEHKDLVKKQIKDQSRGRE